MNNPRPFVCYSEDWLKMAAPAPEWTYYVGAVGIGSIVASLVSWLSAKTVTKANHRRDWTDALRNDLASYLGGVDVLRFRLEKLEGNGGDPPTTADLDTLQDARHALRVIYNRILLRLDLQKPTHVDLADSLNDHMKIGSDHSFQIKSERVLKLAQGVLNGE